MNDIVQKVGVIYNKKGGVKEDIIRLRVHSLSTDVDVRMRLDEAAQIAGGLSKTAAYILSGITPGLKQFYRQAILHPAEK